MAELVDAPASGAGILTGVEVRVFFWAPNTQKQPYFKAVFFRALLCIAVYKYLLLNKFTIISLSFFLS